MGDYSGVFSFKFVVRNRVVKHFSKRGGTELGMVHAYSPVLWRQNQEAPELETSLGCTR